MPPLLIYHYRFVVVCYHELVNLLGVLPVTVSFLMLVLCFEPGPDCIQAGYEGRGALLSLNNEMDNKIARLEWRVSPEQLQLSALPQWANLT